MNGVVIIDKPYGKTSHGVVRDVIKALAVKKAGHTGTLDPLATGVLPVCINEATKLVQFFSSDTKDYRATMQLGLKTDTLDIEGAIIARDDNFRVSPNDIERALCRFIGAVEQVPPRYSAIKFRGRSLYKWARKGIAVEPPKRVVEISRIEINAVELPFVTFTLTCSKGTYVRSLCSDVGDMLGCGACLVGLRRLRSGNFLEARAVSIENLDNEKKREILTGNVISMIDALPDLPSVEVDHEYAEKLREGHQPTAEAIRKYHIPSLASGDMIKFINCDVNLVAVAKTLYSSDQIDLLEKEKQVIKLLRIFNGGSEI